MRGRESHFRGGSVDSSWQGMAGSRGCAAARRLTCPRLRRTARSVERKVAEADGAPFVVAGRRRMRGPNGPAPRSRSAEAQGFRSRSLNLLALDVSRTHGRAVLSQPSPSRSMCLFCSTDLASGRSKEHVLPNWLLEHLRIRDAGVTPTHFGPDGRVVSTRKHALEQLQEGRVCTSCNCGWMSSLETDCKPILTSVFDCSRSIVDLPAGERIVLARWAAKTVYVLNSASNFGQQVPLEHYSSLRSSAAPLPENVVVLAQQHDGTKPFNWIQGAFWHAAQGEPPVPADLAQNTYKVSIQLRRLLLLVAWWPHRGWRYAIQRGIHVPMWPQNGPLSHYGGTGSEFPWDDSEAALATFHAGLMLAQEPRC